MDKKISLKLAKNGQNLQKPSKTFKNPSKTFKIFKKVMGFLRLFQEQTNLGLKGGGSFLRFFDDFWTFFNTKKVKTPPNS
jgi:hypothetical protein